MKSKIFFLLIILMIFSSTSFAKETESNYTGIYSNMYYNKEGGDVLGIELFLVYTRAGYYVVFQSSEGEPEIPQVIPVIIKNKNIEFIVPPSKTSSYYGKFTGQFKNKYLIGKFENYDETIKLKRKGSYWQK